MKKFFSIIFFLLLLSVNSVYSQDTAVYKREYQNKSIDTCENKIVHLWVGCGHPEHYLQMCDGHTLEKLQVFDRWGTLLHVFTDQFYYIELRDKNGTILREDTYIYSIKYRTRSGELKTSTGHFTYIP